jgi:hypothetical protein
MCAEKRDNRQQPYLRFQFTLQTLLGLTAICAVALAMVAWLGPDRASWFLVVGGFCSVLLGNLARRDSVIVCGGLLMVAACVILVLLGLGRMTLQ